MSLGIGVMLNELMRSGDAAAVLEAAIGKTIGEVRLSDDRLRLGFSDGSAILFRDDGQSCCESRYMRTDDDLIEYVGAALNGAELLDAPNQPDEYGEHEVQFLVIQTSKGSFRVSSHNEHNGYYGGFALTVEPVG